jgi:hypothetical protein
MAHSSPSTDVAIVMLRDLIAAETLASSLAATAPVTVAEAGGALARCRARPSHRRMVLVDRADRGLFVGEIGGRASGEAPRECWGGLSHQQIEYWAMARYLAALLKCCGQATHLFRYARNMAKSRPM